jgi:hypothetical protein
MLLLIGSVFFFVVPVRAQTDFHRAAVPVPDSNSAAVQFERNVNTYLWNANAAYLFDDGDLLVRWKDKFTSTYIRGPYGAFRDEHNLNLSLSKGISGPYSAAFDLRSFILSDQQSFGSSTAAIHSAAGGITYQPSANISVTPMAGVRSDQQQSNSDRGWNLRLHTRGDSIEAGEYRAGFSGQLNQSDLGIRRFRNDAAAVKLETEFAEGSTDSISVRWSLNRNDFYIPADSNVRKTFGASSNIRSRTDEVWGIRNSLVYGIGSGLSSVMEVEVESRSVRNAFIYQPLSVLSSIPFNTSVQEFRIDGTLRLEYLSDGMMAAVGLQMGERNEKHQIERIGGVDALFQQDRASQESRLDNIAFRNSVTASVLSELSERDRIQFSGSVGLLQYDTPDAVNTDDRDELLVNVSLTETHRFSEFFTASVTGEATFAHLVYLSAKKSANNNWNRIIRLKPEMTYRPAERFRMFNAFEVQANYTVFDFEAVVPSVRSYSYRQVAFLDSTSYDMTKRVGFDLTAYVRVYERGELRWKEFLERPLQRIEEVTFSPQVRYTPDGRWSFAAGFRSFAQKRFTYTNAVRRYESSFLSAGPTTAVTVTLTPASSIEIRGWKEFQRQSGGAIQQYSNMTMNVRYYF